MQKLLELLADFFQNLSLRYQKWEAEKQLGVARSPEWPKVRAEHLKKYPTCAVCGKTKRIIPHHKVPFSVDKSLELEPLNLVSLCESAGMHCHITFGHKGNFRRWNPAVKEDVDNWARKIALRP